MHNSECRPKRDVSRCWREKGTFSGRQTLKVAHHNIGRPTLRQSFQRKILKKTHFNDHGRTMGPCDLQVSSSKWLSLRLDAMAFQRRPSWWPWRVRRWRGGNWPSWSLPKAWQAHGLVHFILVAPFPSAKTHFTLGDQMQGLMPGILWVHDVDENVGIWWPPP